MNVSTTLKKLKVLTYKSSLGIPMNHGTVGTGISNHLGCKERMDRMEDTGSLLSLRR